MEKEVKDFIGFKEKSLFNKIYLVVLFFSFVDFYQIGIYFLIAISFIGLIINWRGFSLSRSFVPIAFFCGLYFIGCAANGEITYGVKFLCLILVWCYLFYAFSHRLIGVETLIVAGIGMASHGALNFFYNTFRGVSYNSGVTYDVFTQEVASSTGQATNFTLLIPIFYWGVFFQKKRILKVLIVALYAIALIYDTLIGGRTFILLSLISLVLFFVFNLFFLGRNKESKKNIFVLFVVAVIILFLSIIVNFSAIFGNFFKNSYLFTRLEYQNAVNIFDDERFYRVGKYIELMPSYLYGGNHIRIDHFVGYAHNTWLDIFDDAGIFAFLFFFILTVRVIFLSVKVISNSSENFGTRCTYLLLVTNLYIHLLIEPIQRGAPLLICALIMYDSYLCGKKQSLQKQYENCNALQFY